MSIWRYVRAIQFSWSISSHLHSPGMAERDRRMHEPFRTDGNRALRRVRRDGVIPEYPHTVGPQDRRCSPAGRPHPLSRNLLSTQSNKHKVDGICDAIEMYNLLRSKHAMLMPNKHSVYPHSSYQHSSPLHSSPHQQHSFHSPHSSPTNSSYPTQHSWPA